MRYINLHKSTFYLLTNNRRAGRKGPRETNKPPMIIDQRLLVSRMVAMDD